MSLGGTILVPVPGVIKTERFQDLLRNRQVLEFSRKIITENYVECAPGHEDAMRSCWGGHSPCHLLGR